MDTTHESNNNIEGEKSRQIHRQCVHCATESNITAKYLYLFLKWSTSWLLFFCSLCYSLSLIFCSRLLLFCYRCVFFVPTINNTHIKFQFVEAKTIACFVWFGLVWFDVQLQYASSFFGCFDFISHFIICRHWLLLFLSFVLIISAAYSGGNDKWTCDSCRVISGSSFQHTCTPICCCCWFVSHCTRPTDRPIRIFVDSIGFTGFWLPAIQFSWDFLYIGSDKSSQTV